MQEPAQPAGGGVEKACGELIEGVEDRRTSAELEAKML